MSLTSIHKSKLWLAQAAAAKASNNFTVIIVVCLPALHQRHQLLPVGARQGSRIAYRRKSGHLTAIFFVCPAPLHQHDQPPSRSSPRGHCREDHRAADSGKIGVVTLSSGSKSANFVKVAPSHTPNRSLLGASTCSSQKRCARTKMIWTRAENTTWQLCTPAEQRGVNFYSIKPLRFATNMSCDCIARSSRLFLKHACVTQVSLYIGSECFLGAEVLHQLKGPAPAPWVSQEVHHDAEADTGGNDERTSQESQQTLIRMMFLDTPIPM